MATPLQARDFLPSARLKRAGFGCIMPSERLTTASRWSAVGAATCLDFDGEDA